MPVVDFLIAGVQKGGTTALHSFLSAHPDLFLPDRKELHFFDNEGVDWAKPDYSPYERWFEARAEGQVCGEATPIYTYWPGAAERIKAYRADIRMIVALRNPVDRAYSQWAMVSQRGQETLPFGEAIREGRSRVDSRNRRFSYVERGFYFGQMQALLALFPRQALHFLRNDDIRQRHTETLDQICDFLGVARFEVYPESRMIRPAVPQGGGQRPMDAADRAYLVELYADDVTRTESLTGLDLSAWR